MDVVVLPDLSLADFLTWEREQPGKYEFDGTQPIPMTGGTVAHARLVRRVMEALARSLPPQFEAFGGDLKVFVEPDRIRYPDVLVLHGKSKPDSDTVEPVVVFAILSPSATLIDRRVKPAEYASVPSVVAYIILSPEGPVGATMLRRATGWRQETPHQTIELPEIGFRVMLTELYRG